MTALKNTTKIIFLLLFTSVINVISGQEKFRLQKPGLLRDGDFGCKIGLNYDFKLNDIRADIGVFKWNRLLSDKEFSELAEIYNHNIFFSTEINLTNNKLLVGPKVGYELNLAIIQMRLNAIEYLDSRNRNLFVFRPELGLTFLGWASLTYGYNTFILGNNYNFIGRHTVAFTYNLSMYH